MKSVFEIQDNDLAESCYDIPGSRFWLQRTPQGYLVYGWKYLTWPGRLYEYAGEYKDLSWVFAAFLLDIPGAEGMIGGSRCVLAKIRDEAN